MNKMQRYYSLELTSSEARRAKKVEKTLAEVSAKRRKHTKFTQRFALNEDPTCQTSYLY